MKVSKLWSFVFTHFVSKFSWAEKEIDGLLTVLYAQAAGLQGVADTLPKGHSADIPHQVKGQGRVYLTLWSYQL